MKSRLLSEKELQILKLVQSSGQCTATEIAERLPIRFNLIEVLRMIHGLHRKDLVEQILTGGESLYTLSEEGKYFLSRLNGKSNIMIKA